MQGIRAGAAAAGDGPGAFPPKRYGLMLSPRMVGPIMRKFSTIAALAASTLLLAACDGGSSAAPEPSATSLVSATSTEAQAAPEENGSGDGITVVPGEKFMPNGVTTTRIFQLADGSTECFMNELSGDAYLTCRADFAEPPMVKDYAGNDVAANAVTWTPNGVEFAVMDFPQVSGIATLNPRERLEAFGFTCTAYGESTVECSGPQGAATIDNGQVTGASVPEPTQAPEPDAGAPGAPGGEGPQLPGIDDIIGNLPGQ